MYFSDALYVIILFTIITFLYMAFQAGQIHIERRLSLGRAQVNRLIVENARRLSTLGLKVERRFSCSMDQQDPQRLSSATQRKVHDSISEIVEEPDEGPDKAVQGNTDRMNDGSNGCAFGVKEASLRCNSVTDLSDGTTGLTATIHPVSNTNVPCYSKTVEQSSSDGHTTRNEPLKCPMGVPPAHETQKQDNTTSVDDRVYEPRLSRRSSTSIQPSRINNGTRRDSVLPVFNTPKSLPRRKSVMPVLMEDHSQVRRPSIVVTLTPPLSTISDTQKEVVLVKSPAYVCPRRSSVLFNSALFAHQPGRRPSKSEREDANVYDDLRDKLDSSTNDTTHHEGAGDRGSHPVFWQKGLGKLRRMSSTGNLYRPRRGSMVIPHVDLANIGETDAKEVLGSSGGSCPSLPSQERRSSIPKLKGNYLTGNLTEFKKVFGPAAHDELTAKFHRYGPVYQISGLGQKVVFLFDYKDIDSMKKAEGKCPKHMDFKHLRIYRQRNNLPLGVLLSSGEDWKRQRSILSKAMNSTVVQLQYLPVINQTAKEVVKVINGKLSLGAFSEIFIPEADVNNYSIEAFGRVLYGRTLDCLSPNEETDLHKFLEIAKSNFEDAKALMNLPSCLMLLHPAWRRHNEKWNFLLETTIKQSLLSINDDKKMPCVLSHLLKHKKMTESEMLVNLTDLLLASIDTTSTAIHWCLYELAKHPESVTNIVEDYKHYVGDNTDVTLGHIQSMAYLKAVIKETLRLHPVGFLAIRTISRQMCVQEYKVQSQANVASCMYVMGRNKNLVNDPDTFRPDRWLKDNQDLNRFYKDVPFGFGSRMCLGRRIAEIEIALFLLHFCLNFDFRLNPLCQLDHVVKLLLVPSRPLEIYIKARKD